MAIFLQKNDSRIAAIPAHPNCRCYVEAVEAIVAGTATLDGTNGVDLFVAAYGKLPDNYRTWVSELLVLCRLFESS